MSSGGWISTSSQKVTVIAGEGNRIYYSGERLKDRLTVILSDEMLETVLTPLMMAIDEWITTSDDLDYRGNDEVEYALTALRDAGAAVFNVLAGSEPARLRTILRKVVYLEVKVEAKHVPWEFLYLGSTDAQVDLEGFLGSQMVVGRPCTNSEYTNNPDVANDTLAPTDTAGLRVGVVEDNMLASARSGAERSIFMTTRLPFTLMSGLNKSADIHKLEAFLRASPFLTHFNCHAEIDKLGGSYSLRMTNKFNVTRVDMSGMGVCEDSMIFLNCCHGHGMLHRSTANTLANTFASKNVGVVVAATHRILDSDGTRWAQYFYEALLAGQAVGPAILAARKRMIANTGNPSCLVYSFIGQYNLTLETLKLDFAA